MTKRFDRDVNRKIHITTLCAMAHLDYKQKATHDYAQYFMVISKLELGYLAMEEAFRRMTFNVMAANGDDQTKNHSFIMAESGSWQLAPAYDVTHAYSPAREWTHQHLMSVNGKFVGITREDLLAVANRFGIGTAKKVIHEVGEAVSNWIEFARETGVDHNEASKIKSHHIIL